MIILTILNAIGWCLLIGGIVVIAYNALVVEGDR